MHGPATGRRAGDVAGQSPALTPGLRADLFGQAQVLELFEDVSGGVRDDALAQLLLGLGRQVSGARLGCGHDPRGVRVASGDVGEALQYVAHLRGEVRPWTGGRGDQSTEAVGERTGRAEDTRE